jgi:polyhydroxybutyrate depolymerase
MPPIWVFFVAALFVMTLIAWSLLRRQDPRVSLTVDGRTRTFLVHAPAKADSASAGAYPLVLAFHGGTQSAASMRRISRFNDLSEREGFIVVYPEGVQHHWNDPRGVTAPSKMNVDDVLFVKKIIEHVGRQFPVDPKRIYAVGVSNGGLFSYRLACEMSDTFAAVATVVASMASSSGGRPRPVQPISVIAIQGDQDTLVPIEGGIQEWWPNEGERGILESADQTRAFWVAHNQCESQPMVTPLPATANDGTCVTRIVHSHGSNGTEVIWYIIHGGGHRWPPNQAPDRIRRFIDLRFGLSSKNLEASEVIWQFLKEHPKQ